MDQREGWEQRQMQGWSGSNAAPSVTPEQLLALLQAAGLSDEQGTYAQIQPQQHITAPTASAPSASNKPATASRSTAPAKTASAVGNPASTSSNAEQVPLSAYTDGAMPSNASASSAPSAPTSPSTPSLPSDVTAAIAAAIAAAGGYFANSGTQQAPSAPASKGMQTTASVLEGELMPRDAASAPSAITGSNPAKRLTTDGVIRTGGPTAEAVSTPAALLLQHAGLQGSAPMDMASYRALIQAILQDSAMAQEVADRNVMRHGKGETPSVEAPAPKPKIKPKLQQGAKAAARLVR